MSEKPHAFLPSLAAEFGDREAIAIHAFQWWIGKHVTEREHLYEGRYWCYLSVREASASEWPYWTEEQVRRILASLVAQGVFVTGNFWREAGWRTPSRTTWYAFADEARFLGRVSGETPEPNREYRRTKFGKRPDPIGQTPSPSKDALVSAPESAWESTAATCAREVGVPDGAARAAAAVALADVEDAGPTLTPAAELLHAAGFRADLAARLAGDRAASEVAALLVAAQGMRRPSGFLHWFLTSGEPLPPEVAGRVQAQARELSRRADYSSMRGPKPQMTQEESAEWSALRASLSRAGSPRDEGGRAP